MEKVLRAKVIVTSVKHVVAADKSYSAEEVELQAVHGNTNENKDWSKYTPSADFRLQITNPNAFNKLPVGEEFFIDFVPAK